MIKMIDFRVMGLDDIASDFLNWCMWKRDNLEFVKECKTLELFSTNVVLHLDHLGNIKRIDRTICHKRD